MNLEQTNIKAPFNVPEGYFKSMEERILSEVKISEISKLSALQVPYGYFNALENQILASVKIEGLLKKEETPEDYFTEMESQILSRIKIEGLTQPKVESNYFDTLEDRILSESKLDILKSLKQQPVPISYFDNLEDNIYSKTIEKRKANFTLFKNTKIYRSAAAIALFGLIAYSVSVFKPQPAQYTELSDISSDAMIAYLYDQPLMEEDLSFVLEENTNPIASTDISDDEISDYLLENGI